MGERFVPKDKATIQHSLGT